MNGTPRTPRQCGATLVEMVAVILILAIASTAIMDQFVNTADTYLVNESLQTSAQLAQECAEHILATRRLQSYATAVTTNCLALPAVYTAAGYIRNATVAASPTCVTAPCTQVDVVVSHNGDERARVVFMLGSY